MSACSNGYDVALAQCLKTNLLQLTSCKRDCFLHFVYFVVQLEHSMNFIQATSNIIPEMAVFDCHELVEYSQYIRSTQSHLEEVFLQMMCDGQDSHYLVLVLIGLKLQGFP